MKGAVSVRTLTLLFLVLQSCDCRQHATGRVIDRETGKPLKGALVYSACNTIATDTGGYFESNCISGGLFRCPPMLVRIECAGYRPETAQIPLRGSNVVEMRKEYSLISGFPKYLKDCKVQGSMVVYDESGDTWHVSDTTDIKVQRLPASTFKIINLLIALETKSIKNEFEVVKWVGSTDTAKYGYRPDIYHDMTVQEAFTVSAGWVFMELAKKIGKENYRKYLKACNYGNQQVPDTAVDFWNFGKLGISALEQAQFMKALFDEKLPFSKRNIKILQWVMVQEKNKEYVLGAKTGWTNVDGMNIGWWVGYIKTKNGMSFFACRITQEGDRNSPTFGACRKNITKAVLKELGIMAYE